MSGEDDDDFDLDFEWDDALADWEAEIDDDIVRRRQAGSWAGHAVDRDVRPAPHQPEGQQREGDDDLLRGGQQDADVEGDVPVLDVVQIEPPVGVEGRVRAGLDLPQSRDARPDLEALP